MKADVAITTVNLSRRRFVRNSTLLSGGLVLGSVLPWEKLVAAAGAAEDLEPNALIAVRTDGRVVMQFTWNELGQGALTSLAAVVAEELCVTRDDVDVESPIWEPKYGYNATGGSQSMRNSWDPLRKAAAAARVMLVAAGAAHLGAAPGDCKAEDGHVVGPGGRRVPYVDLISAASVLEVPADPPLIPRSEHRIVGTRYPRRDTPSKVRGEPVFASDITKPGLLRAAIRRSPVPGGKLRSVDDAAARAIPGVRDVITVGDRVVVLAADTWTALRGREVLRIEWDDGEYAAMNSADTWAAMKARSAEPGYVLRNNGDVTTALAGAARVVRAEYRAPMIAHAAMEPSTCTAHVHDGVCDLEVPTQMPASVHRGVAEALGIHDIRVSSTWVGSAFGRRLFPDHAVDAALVSQAVGGPVQVVWTREDEMRHDFYRPCSLHLLAGGLDVDGRVVALDHTVVASPIGARDPGAAAARADEGVMRGVSNSPYAPSSYRATHAPMLTGMPLGYWRGVFDVQNAFVQESFLDELSQAGGVDPVELRLAMLAPDARLRRVVEEAAVRSGWPHASGPGRTVGFACHECFGSVGAQVAEVSLDGDRPVMHRIVSVIECGPAVNPDAVRAQMEGGAAMALSTVLRERITWKDGRVEQGNFDDYRILRCGEMPEIETHILKSDRPIGGVGEPVVPPTAPAVCNALSRARGARIRELPLG